MKYQLTDNVKKAIAEFEELLKNFTQIQNKKKEILKEAKKKVENAISLIKRKDK